MATDSTEPEEYGARNLAAVEQKLGIAFKDRDILRSALTRKTWRHEHPDSTIEDNERLEFLGDSVLRLLLSESCYLKTGRTEGEMTRLRIMIEKGDTLASVAREIDLLPHILMNKSDHDDPLGKSKILGDALEALIGAIYLDQGLDASRTLVEKIILNAFMNQIIGEKC